MTEQALLPLAIRPLPGGSVLYHIRNHSRITRIEAVMRTGSIHEGADAGCGLSHFLEHMLFQGCSSYPGNSASERIHQLGGDCNAYTTFDHTAYYAEVPLEQFAAAADVITSMITSPLFPEDKFISEKAVIAREADMIFDRANHQLIQQLWQGLFSVHPARMPIIGYPDKIAGVSRDTMCRYYQNRYGAMRCHWLVSGALDTDMIQQQLAEKLASFTRGNLSEIELPQEPPALFESRYTTEFADPLCRIALGIRSPRAQAVTTPALDLLSGILGGSDSSCLPVRFLYQDPLALAVDAEYDLCSFGGVLAITAACEPNKAAALEQGLRAELAKIRKCGISVQALEREKLQQRLTIYQQLKNTSSTVAMVNSMRMNFGNADALAQYISMLENVTLDEINAVAADYLDPRRFVWSIVSPKQEKSSCFMPQQTLENNPIRVVDLSSQTRAILLERNHIPMDSISILLPAGPVWENGYPHGISQLLAKVLATGPADTAEEEFYTELDDLGIDLDISCGFNTMSVEMSFPPEVRQQAAEIMQRILTNPRQDEEIFLRLQDNLINQLSSKLMEPKFAAMLKARRQLFGSHPGGNSRLESVEDLQKITMDVLQKFYTSRWDKTLVKFGSTIAPQDPAAAASATSLLDNIAEALPWQDSLLERPRPITEDELLAQAADEPFFIELPREQSAVICAIPGGFAHTREYYSLLIMDSALNGLASNLFKEVREKRSLAYYTGVSVSCGLVQGVIALYAGVQPANAPAALECLKNEICRLAENGLEEEEFAAAKLTTISAAARQLESSDTQLLHVLLADFYGDDPLTSLDSTAKLSSITREECNNTLNRIFSAPAVISVIAGSRAKAHERN
ncbi:MAG: insulinase family protein [Lentisphaerae bacterium]|nr:insulinase family protein [Lentisphaerota bacterium]